MVDHSDDRQGQLRRGIAGDDAACVVRRPRSVTSRVAWRCCGALVGLVAVAVVCLVTLFVVLTYGPVAIRGLGPRIADALQDRFGHGATFTVGTTSLVRRGFDPSLSIDGLSIKGPDGQKVLSAPRAEISIDAMPLLTGQVVPKRLEVFDLELRLVLLKNGNLALAAGDGARPFFELARSPDPPPPPPVQVPVLQAPVRAPSAQPGATPPAPLANGATDGTAEVSAPPHRAVAMQQAARAIRVLLDTITNPTSPIAAVDRLGIRRGRLLIEDQTTDEEVVYKNLDVSFDKTANGTTFSMSADGPSQRWSVSAGASGMPGTQRQFAVEAKGFSQDELQLLAGTRSLGFDTDIPLSLSFHFGLRPNNTLSEAAGEFGLGAGFLRLEDPDEESYLIQRVSGGFHWDGAKRRIEIDRSIYEEGTTRFAVDGSIVPPTNEGEPWTIALGTTGPGVLGPDRLGQEPVVIDRGQFAGRLFLDRKQLLIDRFAFNSGREGGLALAGTVDWEHGPRIRVGASIDPTTVRVAKRVWPAFVASPIRAWLLTHFEDGILSSGTMRIDYDQDALTRMRSDRAPPDESIALDFTITKGRLGFLPGVPPVQDVVGTGHVSGHSSRFVLASGAMETSAGRIALSDGSFSIADFDVHPVQARITAHVSGPVEAIGDILSRDALKAYASLPLDPATLKGQVDGHLDEHLLLGVEDEEAQLHADATVTNFSADKLVGKEKLENATVTLAVEPNGMKATGQGRLFGAPATFEITRTGDKTPDAIINVTLDEAARNRLGLGAAVPGLTGPLSARIAASGLGQPRMKAQVDLDLAKMAVNAGFIGLTKPAGKPAKVSFSLQPGDTHTLLDGIAIDIGSLQGRGSVELGSDGSLQSAHFSSLKVSPGDDMKLDVARGEEAPKLTIRGSTIDARPFLRALTQTPGELVPAAKSGNGKGDADLLKGFDVDLKSGILTGFNKEVLSDAELRLSKRGPQIRQFALQGRFGRAALSGTMTANQRLRVTTQDAGALVSFIDLYKHMEGGQLSASMLVGDDTLNGNLEIQGFTLRDEPAMRKLVAQSLTSSQPGDSAATAARSVDSNAVGFTKLKVDFHRAGSRLELRNATMYGSAIGLSVDGWLDYVHDRVDMKGTFVPAFAVNNLFSQVPVLGFFLGGASNEGLFAITFRISGAANSPTLSVNPLSAIAPGFLRKIFGALDTNVNAGGADGGEAPDPQR